MSCKPFSLDFVQSYRKVNIMHYIYFCLLSITCIIASSSGASEVDKQLQSFVIEVDDKYCGRSYCSDTKTTDLTPNRSCRECSCEIDCFLRQNCCPSTAFKYNGVYHELDDVKSCISTDISGRYADSVPYIVVTDKCPEDYPDGSWKSRCENSIDITPLNLIPCMGWSRFISPTFYKNIYCAACNYAQSVQPFSLAVSCNSSDIIFQATSERDFFDKTINNTGCKFEAEFAQRKVVECHPNDKYLIRSCNETGLWKKRDEMIEQGCELEIYKVPVNEKYYNIFCFLCNTDQELDELFQESRTPSIEIVKPVAYLEGLPQTLAERRSHQSSSVECFNDDLFIDNQERCLTIHCSPGRYYNGFDCESPFHSNLFGYEVCVEVETEEDDITRANSKLQQQISIILDTIKYLLFFFPKSVESFDIERWNCTKGFVYKQQYKIKLLSDSALKREFMDSFFLDSLINATVRMNNNCGRIFTDSCLVESMPGTASDKTVMSNKSSLFELSNHVIFIPFTRIITCCQVTLNESDYSMKRERDIYIYNSKKSLGFNDYFLHENGSITVCLFDFLMKKTLICNEAYVLIGGAHPRPTKNWFVEEENNDSETFEDGQPNLESNQNTIFPLYTEIKESSEKNGLETDSDNLSFVSSVEPTIHQVGQQLNNYIKYSISLIFLNLMIYSIFTI